MAELGASDVMGIWVSETHSGFNPVGAAASGADLFIAANFANQQSKVDVCPITGNLPQEGAPGTHMYYPDGLLTAIAVSGSNVFVMSEGTISEYTISGATINPSLVTGLSEPIGLTAFGSFL